MTIGFNLKANARTKVGSAESRKIRSSGHLPAVILTKDGNLNISIVAKDLEHQYHKGNLLTTITEIEVDGKKIKALPHKIELDPVTDRPIHVDFVEVVKDKPVKAQVKLVFANKEKSPGLKKGGFLHIVLRKIAVFCSADAIPETIEIDVGATQVGSKIRSENLKLPNGVKVADKSNFLVASIIGRGSKDDEEDKPTATTADATAGASAPAGDAKAGAAGAKAPAGGDKKEAEKKPAAKK